MSNIIPFESAQLPAALSQFNDLVSGDDLTAGATGGFPVISIKGKVFHIVRGDERALVTRADTGEPMTSLELVILRANPALSKIYYEKRYEEGDESKPDCYSTDGVAPAADAAKPQSQKCATCPHNQWGSRLTDNGGKGKACADSRRLAVAPVGQLNDVMLLRVPAASLKTLAQYGDQLKKRGVAYPAVSTLVSFDWNVAHPALTFKPVGFLTEPMLQAVSDVLRSDLPGQVCGILASPRQQALPAPQPAPQPAPAPVQQPAAQVTPPPQPVAPKPAPKPAAKPAATKKANTVSFGGSGTVNPVSPNTAPTPVRPAPQPQVRVADDDLMKELGQVLQNAGFDDVAA